MNPYARRHGPLKTACLPIPPPRRIVIFIGRSGGTRTPDLRFWRPLLYQTELHSSAPSRRSIATAPSLVKKAESGAGTGKRSPQNARRGNQSRDETGQGTPGLRNRPPDQARVASHHPLVSLPPLAARPCHGQAMSLALASVRYNHCEARRYTGGARARTLPALLGVTPAGFDHPREDRGESGEGLPQGHNNSSRRRSWPHQPKSALLHSIRPNAADSA